MGDFPQRIAEMVNVARPKMPQGSQGVTNVGPVSMKSSEGYRGIGTSFGAGFNKEFSKKLDYRYNPEKIRERVLFMAGTISEMGQSEEGKALRAHIIGQKSTQKYLSENAKYAVGVVYQREDGMWDIADSSFLKQRYEKGEAGIAGSKAGTGKDIAATGAIVGGEGRAKELQPGALEAQKVTTGKDKAATAGIVSRTETEDVTRNLNIRLLSSQVNALIASTEGQDLGNKETRMQMLDKLEQLKVNIAAMKESTKGAAQERRQEKELHPSALGLSKEKVLTERVQQKVLGAQEGRLKAETERITAMTPLEKAYMEAGTELRLAEAEHKGTQLRDDMEKLRFGAQSRSIVKLIDDRASIDDAVIEKEKYAKMDPHEKAKISIEATQDMISGFGKAEVQVGVDEKGDPEVVQIPGAIKNPRARYWVRRSLNQGYNSFEELWEEGSELSLKNAQEVRDMYRALYVTTYGQLQDNRAYKMLDPMPNVAGWTSDEAEVLKLYKRLVTMTITLDSLEPWYIDKGGKRVINPKKLLADDQIFKIASKLGLQAVKPKVQHWYKDTEAENRVQKQEAQGGQNANR